MPGRRTFYQILQVDKEADADVISTVHRRLAQRYHPDRDPSPDAQRKMREINQAYDVLKNPDLRASYDAELLRRQDRRSSDRFVRRTNDQFAETQPMTAASEFGEAGPPRGPAHGSVLDFGRYKGWSLGQIAAYDPDFLEWFERSPGGRQYRNEIATLKARYRA